MSTDDTPCLIVECSDAHEWPGLWSAEVMQRLKNNEPQRIPLARRPAVLQPNRAIAEAEAKRLAERNPGKRFVVFEAAAAATTVTIPTHTTVSGYPWGERRVAVLLGIGEDDGVPF